jgi:aspartyl-tRNA(Asn)/glutamyl-tRNA(Gln) amidotransferase subunit C
MIEKSVIENIAKLARLDVADEQLEEYSQQLSVVMQNFEQITRVKTDNIEPLVTPSEIEVYWRSDEIKQELSSDEILANAPDKIGNLFRVPPVI